jgi:transposase InsO family protein
MKPGDKVTVEEYTSWDKVHRPLRITTVTDVSPRLIVADDGAKYRAKEHSGRHERVGVTRITIRAYKPADDAAIAREGLLDGAMELWECAEYQASTARRAVSVLSDEDLATLAAIADRMKAALTSKNDEDE